MPQVTQRPMGSPHGVALPALRAARELRGLTQEQLAARAGLSERTISVLESGSMGARPSNALKLAQALSLPLDVLRGCAPLPTPEEESRPGILTAYLDAAMRHAIYRRVGGQHLYAAIPGLPGLWARGYTREEAARDLRGALEWWVLTAVFHHQPLPAYDDVSLEISEENAQGERVLYPIAPASTESFLDGVEDAAPVEE